MKISFVNGTKQQQGACQFVAHNLLNLPYDAIPLDLTVEFISDPDPSQHNEFAITEWTYGSVQATIKIASRAPQWNPPYRGIKFLNEVFAHELGHALFAALPQAVRVEIAQMFGATSDDIDELQPSGSAWANRIIEGIAETFKDAFLPQRYRFFPNRTNETIPYHRFPAFRALWRQAMPEIETGEPLEPGEEEVPSYNADIFAVGEPMVGEGWLNYLAATNGKKGLWGSAYFWVSGPPLHNSQLVAAAFFEGWVKDGTVLNYSFTITPDLFIAPPYFEPKAPLQQYNDFGIRWRLLKKTSAGAEYTELHRAEWSTTVMPVEISEAFGAEQVGGYNLWDEAIGGGAPPVTFSRSIIVNAANFPKTRKCHGATYRYVGLRPQIEINLTAQYPETTPEHEKIRGLVTYPWIPSETFSQPACTEGSGEPGLPVVVPPPLLLPGGANSEAKPHRRPVVGNYH